MVTSLKYLFLLIGLFLMGLNLYGLTQPIRYPGLFETQKELLRFPVEGNYSFSETMGALDSFKPAENGVDTTRDLNKLVNNALTHVHWTKVDAQTYRQLVPAWENYFLYLIGKFSPLPQFNRYHFSDYRRTLERGIGQCGDASIVLSSLLDSYDIESNIIAYPQGHVIVEQIDESGRSLLFDPDFGVELGVSLDELPDKLDVVENAYLAAGYDQQRDIDLLLDVFQTEVHIYDDTKHFMTMRYYFERISYVLKWVLPTFLLAIALLLGRRQTRLATAVDSAGDRGRYLHKLNIRAGSSN